MNKVMNNKGHFVLFGVLFFLLRESKAQTFLDFSGSTSALTSGSSVVGYQFQNAGGVGVHANETLNGANSYTSNVVNEYNGNLNTASFISIAGFTLGMNDLDGQSSPNTQAGSHFLQEIFQYDANVTRLYLPPGSPITSGSVTNTLTSGWVNVNDTSIAEGEAMLHDGTFTLDYDSPVSSVNVVLGVDPVDTGPTYGARGFVIDAQGDITVPEPSSTLLIGMSGMALILRRRN